MRESSGQGNGMRSHSKDDTEIRSSRLPRCSTPSTFLYQSVHQKGTRSPICLQNSQRLPLPPSQVFASTTRMSFASPGSLYCVAFGIVVTTRELYGIPPVSFRFSILQVRSPCSLNVGHSCSLDGSLLTMKLPHVLPKTCTNAELKIRPLGRKPTPFRSAPCCAAGTEY